MVKRLGGSRHKTRYKLKRRPTEHGRLRLTARLSRYSEGEMVSLVIDPSEPKGMFHPRHHGKTGLVVGQQGGGYLVRFKDKGKEKTVIATAVHLRKA